MEPFECEDVLNTSNECKAAKIVAVNDLNDAVDLVQEIESCTRKSKLMTKDLFEGYLSRTSYTGAMLMYYRQDAATRGEIAYCELIKASKLMEKLIGWFDTILKDEPESRLK